MRKSFTRFLSLLFVFCLFSVTSLVYGQSNPQETVELYAGTNSPSCYNESNEYVVKVSVMDFIQLTNFELELNYPEGTLNFDPTSGFTALSAWTGGSVTVTTVTGSPTSKVRMVWNGSPITIGNDLKTDVFQLKFSLDNNSLLTANSITGDLTWATHKFWYTTSVPALDEVNTVISTNGSISIAQSYPATTIETSFVAETCAGGQAKVKVTSPTGVLYSFNGGAFTTSNEFAALPGNNVSIKVKGTSGGCISYAKTVTVPQTIDPVTFSVTATNPSCPGGDASVFVTATGGSGAYTYYYNTTSGTTTGAVTRTNFQFNVPTTTTAKTYYIAVQDANGCVNLADASTWTSVTVQDTNPVVTVTAGTTTNVSCNGGNNGSASVSITPAAVYYVSLDGGTWTTTAVDGTKTFAALTAGTHTVTAKTVSDCTISSKAVYNIIEPDAMQLAIVVDDTSCGGANDGSIAVTVTGGTSSYTLTLTGGTVTPTRTVSDVASTYTFTNLEPTYYSLSVTDTKGCPINYSNPNGTGNVIAVQSPSDINFTVAKTNALCNGGTGTITVTAAGGTGAYKYSKDGGATLQNSNVFAVTAGTYTVTVVNAVGGTCTVTLNNQTITEPQTLTATITSTVAPICASGSDGDITITVGGGTAPYKYTVNGGSWVSDASSPIHIAAMVGTQTITITDTYSCQSVVLVQSVTQKASTVTATTDHEILCNGAKDGKINVTVTSWAGDRTGQIFKWATTSADVYTSAGKTLIPGNAGTGTPTTFDAGTYYVGAIDAYGCKASVVSVTITQKSAVEITSVTATGASCYNTYDGVIAISAKGGNTSNTTTDAIQYAIVNEGITTIPSTSWINMPNYNTTTKVFSVSVQMAKGKYQVAVRDRNCTNVILYSQIIEVTGYDKLMVDESKIVVVQPLCNGLKTGSITVPASAVTGGSGSYKYTLLNNGATVSGTAQQTTGVFGGLATSTLYTVKVEDSAGCPSYTTSATISITEPPVLDFTIDKQNISCFGANDGIITINVTGGTHSDTTAASQYKFAVNNQNLWQSFAGSEKQYLATQPGTYTIWVKDANECTTVSKTVTILEPATISATVTVNKNQTCDSNGQVTVTASGGWTVTATTSFEYKLDGAVSYTANPVFTGIAPGTHTMTIHAYFDDEFSSEYQEPSADCVKLISFTITPYSPITYTVDISNVKCYGGNDGALTVTVLSGGTASSTGGYQVRVTGPSYDKTNWTGTDKVHQFTGMIPGMYTVYITDNVGCTLSSTVGDKVSPYTTIESWEVQQPAVALGVSANRISNVLCKDASNGSFTITATGGVGPYKFFTAKSKLPEHIILPEANDNTAWISVQGSTYTKTDASAGTWIVWTQDANGCIKGGEDLNGVPVNAWRVQITEPNPITFDIALGDVVSPTCNGNSDGSIRVTNIQGGTASYTVTVIGTSKANTAVNVSVTKNATSITVPNLPASLGYYTIQVSDINSCTNSPTTVTRTVNEPAALSVALVAGEGSFTCPGSVEGWINATATGGVAPYKYRLYKDGNLYTGWVDQTTYFVQIGHTWMVEVTDKDGGTGSCTTTAQITINEPKGVSIELEERTCYTDTKASVIVHASGETGRTFQVRYKLNTGSYNAWAPVSADPITGLTFANIVEQQNFYYFQIMDNMGCTTETTYSFVPTQHPLEVSTPVVTDLSATMTVSGGISPYSYKVGSGAVVNLPVDNNTVQIINLPAGQSTITVMDAHGCSIPSVVTVAPLTVTAVPASGATGLKNPINIALTFNRDVTGVASSTTITGSTGTSTVAITGSGKTYTATITGADLATVTLALSNGITDVAGNTLSATTFTYTVGDNTAPKLLTWNPNATTLEKNHPILVMTFDEDVVLGAGNVSIYKVGATTASVVIPVSATTTAISGKTATVTYVATATSGLDQNTDYYVLVDAGVVKDAAANGVAGVTATSTWTFKTGNGFVTGTDPKIDNSLEFKVYPNPFVDFVTVTNASDLSKVVVSNIAGQVVKEVVNPESTIQLNQLVSGVYFISLYQENVVIKTVKIVKR